MIPAWNDVYPTPPLLEGHRGGCPQLDPSLEGLRPLKIPSWDALTAGEGCYRSSCGAGREFLCPACGWWVCLDPVHAVSDHRRCAARLEQRRGGTA